MHQLLIPPDRETAMTLIWLRPGESPVALVGAYEFEFFDTPVKLAGYVEGEENTRGVAALRVLLPGLDFDMGGMMAATCYSVHPLNELMAAIEGPRDGQS